MSQSKPMEALLAELGLLDSSSSDEDEDYGDSRESDNDVVETRRKVSADGFDDDVVMMLGT